MRERNGGRFFQDYASGALQRENLAQAALRWAAGPENLDEDVADHADDLEEYGADPDKLAAWREQAEAALDAQREPEFVLWPENEAIFGVFVRCRWQRMVAGDRVLFEGIDSDEIRAVIDLLQTPREQWQQVIDGVRFCESKAAPVLNSK